MSHRRSSHSHQSTSLPPLLCIVMPVARERVPFACPACLQPAAVHCPHTWCFSTPHFIASLAAALEQQRALDPCQPCALLRRLLTCGRGSPCIACESAACLPARLLQSYGCSEQMHMCAVALHERARKTIAFCAEVAHSAPCEVACAMYSFRAW